MFATRPYRKFTDDHRAFDDVLRRLMKGADATKSATRSYTSPWDRTVKRFSEELGSATGRTTRVLKGRSRNSAQDRSPDADDLEIWHELSMDKGGTA